MEMQGSGVVAPVCYPTSGPWLLSVLVRKTGFEIELRIDVYSSNIFPFKTRKALRFLLKIIYHH